MEREEREKDGERERERERERARRGEREKERESQPPHSNGSHSNLVGAAKPISQPHAQPSVPQHNRPNAIDM